MGKEKDNIITGMLPNKNNEMKTMKMEESKKKKKRMKETSVGTEIFRSTSNVTELLYILMMLCLNAVRFMLYQRHTNGKHILYSELKTNRLALGDDGFRA